MATPSRSSKKQPAFDPSELEDLIHSPAVGKGVGSHLVDLRKPVTSVTSHLATMGTTSVPADIDMTTVVTSHATAMLLLEVSPVATSAAAPIPTGAATPQPASPKPEPDVTTGVDYRVSTVDTSTQSQPLWITENGDLVSRARVKRIRLAQDVINSAEECVYDTLWNAKLISADERESCRLVQAGYDYLVKRTRLARKTIQRIVAKLLEKDFIRIETRADIYQRASTVYRVYSYKAVLERHVRKGRLYVAKMGPGFSYARPLDAKASSSAPQECHPELTTVDTSIAPTIVKSDMSTMVPQTTVTVVKNDRPTVVKMSPYLLDTNNLDNTSSSSPYPDLHSELSKLERIDDDALAQLVAACRANAPDCTESEIVHFVREKARHIQKRESRIHSPVGFLLTSVPKCFSGETLKQYREERNRERESAPARQAEEDASMERWRREQEAVLSDPAVSEQEKHLIRLCLGLNPG